MSLLCWDKPKKIRSTEDHNNMFVSEAGVDGTYVPNMSGKDMMKWKAKHIHKGDDPRVEIRKTTQGKPRGSNKYGTYSQMLLVVRPDNTVVISGNSKSEVDIGELNQAINEAKKVLETS